MKYIVIMTALFLAGCGNVSGVGGSADVIEYYLDDGTRCAILVGAYKGSIDCNWK